MLTSWKNRRPIRLQTLITLLILFIAIISAIVTSIYINYQVESNEKDKLSEKILTIARITAHSDTVINELEKTEDSGRLQVYANEIKEHSDVGFVVVLDMNLIRRSHPIDSEVGQLFYNLEDASDSLKGKEYFSTQKGPLGMGLRVFSPVKNVDGKQIGVVVVGITLDTVEEAVKEGRKIVYIGAFLQVLFGIIGAIAISKYVRKKMFGMEPIEIAKLLKERNMMIESVKEGILAVNEHGRISLANQEAMNLMKIKKPGDIIGKHIKDYMTIFDKVIRTGKPEVNYETSFYGKNVLINCFPIVVNEKVIGGIGMFRDKSELKELVEQLTGIKLYTESLRAQSHEFMNKLHVILGLIHLQKYDEVSQYIENMVDDYEMEKGFIVKRFKNPIFAGFLLGKISKAREMGIHFIIDEKSSFVDEIDSVSIHDFIRIAGNLIDNAFDAVSNCQDKQVFFSLYPIGQKLIMEVRDNGAGIPDEIINHIYTKGYSTKGEDRGYGLYLTKQSIEALKGNIMIQTNAYEGTTFIVKLPISTEEATYHHD